MLSETEGVQEKRRAYYRPTLPPHYSAGGLTNAFLTSSRKSGLSMKIFTSSSVIQSAKSMSPYFS